MLQVLGISDAEERVYRALLVRSGAPVEVLAEATAQSRGALSALLSSLEAKGLVSRLPGRPARYVAAPPDLAVGALIVRREEELERARLYALKLLTDMRGPPPDDAGVEVVEVVGGTDAIAQRFVQLQQGAREEVLVLDRPPYTRASNAKDEKDALARGVVYRGIYDHEALEEPGKLDHIREFAGAGEQARILDAVPLKLAIADRRLALVPHNLDVPGSEASVIVHPSPLLDALIRLFDMLWHHAVPFALAEAATASPSGTSISGTELLDEQDRRILVLMATGLKDDAVARQLGMGTRTVSRRVGQLLALLDAKTRFQAGVAAAKRGWL